MSVEPEAPEAVEPLRTASESVRSIVDRLRESASVESVYGDPVETRERTVIPVARVAYGFGSGFGSAPDADGEGGGVGGGVAATPAGLVEVTDVGTRFVRFGDRRRALAALVVGLLLGLALGRRRRGE